MLLKIDYYLNSVSVLFQWCWFYIRYISIFKWMNKFHLVKGTLCEWVSFPNGLIHLPLLFTSGNGRSTIFQVQMWAFSPLCPDLRLKLKKAFVYNWFGFFSFVWSRIQFLTSLYISLIFFRCHFYSFWVKINLSVNRNQAFLRCIMCVSWD